MAAPLPPHTACRPSPAVAFVGRKNSGKTTLVERLIATLTARGLSLGSIKHHGHPDFTIDVPGKDSYRHRAAGARTTAVLSRQRFALMTDLAHGMNCRDALALMPGHDLIVVEGFRAAGLPTIELMRTGNPRDVAAAPALIRALENGTVEDPSCQPSEADPDNPTRPVGIVTDMPAVAAAARCAQVPVFGFEEIEKLADFVEERCARKPLTIAVQAGGESRRMGQSKARTPFLGRPLIEHMLAVAAPYADELIVTTNEPEELSYLKTAYPALVLARDVRPERGALPGLLTALEASSNELTAVIACDMIALTPRLLPLEAYELQASGADAAVPLHEGGWEPFAGVWRTSTCAPAVEEALAHGSKRMTDLIERVACHAFDPSDFVQKDRINPFANVNTPEELAQAEILYRLCG